MGSFRGTALHLVPLKLPIPQPIRRTGQHHNAEALAFIAPLDPNDAQKFCARAGIGAKGAEHLTGDHRDAALVHAAGRHALVNGVDDDAHTARLEDVIDAGSDLSRELLLDLEATVRVVRGVAFLEAGDLTRARQDLQQAVVVSKGIDRRVQDHATMYLGWLQEKVGLPDGRCDRRVLEKHDRVRTDRR